MTARRIRFWRNILALFCVIGVLIAILFPKFVESLHPSVKQDEQVDQKVTSVITRSKNPKAVRIQIYGLGKRYKQLTYQLKYTVNQKEQIINMVDTPFDLRGRESFTFDAALNGCTYVMCPESTRATKVWIGLAYTDLSGKVIMTGTP